MATAANPIGATILLVEDDPRAARTLQDVLEASGHVVIHVETGADARAAMARQPPDLILMDIGLPDVDGLVLCTALKSIADVPVIFCSGTAQVRDRILGFKVGADDFIAKPFNVLELDARVQAVLRRSRGTADNRAPTPESARPRPTRFEVGGLAVDSARHRVTVNDQPLHVTPQEFRLLLLLASRPEEVLTREDITQAVWGAADGGRGRAIEAQVRRLRMKLESAAPSAPTIVAERGFGYRLVPGTG